MIYVIGSHLLESKEKQASGNSCEAKLYVISSWKTTLWSLSAKSLRKSSVFFRWLLTPKQHTSYRHIYAHRHLICALFYRRCSAFKGRMPTCCLLNFACNRVEDVSDCPRSGNTEVNWWYKFFWTIIHPGHTGFWLIWLFNRLVNDMHRVLTSVSTPANCMHFEGVLEAWHRRARGNPNKWCNPNQWCNLNSAALD